MKKTVAEWARQFEKRPTPSHSPNYQYQIKFAGTQEIRVQGGGEKIWADGIRVEDGFLLEGVLFIRRNNELLDFTPRRN